MATDAPQAYPLQWPAAKPRAKSRSKSRFKATLTLYQAVQRVELELDRIRAKSAVVSSNQAPLSNRNPDDPGVAVYFQLKGRATVLACDKYVTVAENLAAIAAHIEATRLCERHGVATLEEMFAGFLALPAAMAPDDWRGALGNPRTIDEAERKYRDMMKYAHPDVDGGNETVAATLNAAITGARAHFGGDRTR